MPRAEFIWRTQTPLKGSWRVYQDPLIQHHTIGGALCGPPSFQGSSVMQVNPSPLEKVGKNDDRGCPNCGSKESMNRLRQEIRDLEAKKRLEVARSTKPGEQQMLLFAGVYLSDSGSVGIGLAHDVCADCGTCFDYSRLAMAPELQARVKQLRLETESAVDSLGRLDPG